MRFHGSYRLFVVGLLVLPMVTAVRAAEEPAWLHPVLGPLTPSAHFNGAIGDSSGDPESLMVGHHDPTREDGSVQGIELGLSLRLDQLEGFATYGISYGAEEEWEREWEEAFLKLSELPGGFEVRGGRMLGRYGKQNARHLHAWNFVDMPLVLGRFLGEHGLLYDGGDVTWLSRGIELTYGMTVGYGDAIAHEHGEEHPEEDGHDHAEEIAFENGVGSARLFSQFRRNDFSTYESGLSLAIGKDDADRDITVAGIDFTYAWRENGMGPGGRALTWTTEILLRDVDGVSEEHGHENEMGSEEEHGGLPGGSEYGFYTEVVYTMYQSLDLGARLGYVEGNDSLETEERYQISPAVTAFLDPNRRVSLRTQYNYDDLADGTEEHSVWLQLGLSWGGAEVR